MSSSANPGTAAAILLTVLASGCGGAQPSAQPPQQETPQPSSRKSSSPQGSKSPSAGPHALDTRGGGAAAALKAYYGLIEQHDYAGALAFRERDSGTPSVTALADTFQRYSELHVTVGSASPVAESGSWLYVEVPVQTYGRLKEGGPVASAGTVTLRRASGGGAWHILGQG